MEQGFSSGSICLVLASHIYEEDDYIRDYEEFIDITLPEGIELMNRDGVKAEAGIATALIRIGERKGKARIIVSDGQLKGDMEVEIR